MQLDGRAFGPFREELGPVAKVRAPSVGANFAFLHKGFERVPHGAGFGNRVVICVELIQVDMVRAQAAKGIRAGTPSSLRACGFSAAPPHASATGVGSSERPSPLIISAALPSHAPWPQIAPPDSLPYIFRKLRKAPETRGRRQLGTSAESRDSPRASPAHTQGTAVPRARHSSR